MKILDLIEMVIKGLAGIFLSAVFVLVTAQVASRYIFNLSFTALSELSIYAMIWSVFLGAAVAFRGNRHIAMGFIKDKAPQNLQILLNVVIFLCLSLFLSIIIFKGYDLSLRAMRQVSPAAGLQVGYVSMAMPICSVLALIFLIENFLAQVNRASNND